MVPELSMIGIIYFDLLEMLYYTSHLPCRLGKAAQQVTIIEFRCVGLGRIKRN